MGGNRLWLSLKPTHYLLFLASLALMAMGMVWYVRGRAAAPAEVVLLVATAPQSAGGWADQLGRELERMRTLFPSHWLGVQRLRHALTSAPEARAVGAEHKATAVIWVRESAAGPMVVCEFLHSRTVAVEGIALAYPEQLMVVARADSVSFLVLFLQGWLCFLDGQSIPAAAALDQALALASAAELAREQAVAHTYRALLLLEQPSDSAEARARALAHLHQAARLDPDSFAAHYNLALIYGCWCDPDGGRVRAFAEIASALALRPEDDRAHALAGDLYMQERRWREAAESYDRATQLRDDSAAWWNRLGRAYLAAGNTQGAEAAFHMALELGRNALAESGDPHAWRELGLTYRALGLYSEALEAYHHALEQGGDTAEAYRGLGLVYRYLGQMTQALFAYEKAYAASPDNPTLQVEWGDLYREIGETEQATLHYQQAIELAPCRAEPYLALGQMSLARGDIEQARSWLQRGVSFCPDDAAAQMQLGTVCYLLHDWDRAVEALERVVALQESHAAPMSVGPYLDLGSIYLQQGAHDLAISMYTRARAIAPETLEALLGLGDAYTAKGEYEAAAVAYEEARQVAPQSAEIYISLALMYEQSGAVSQAERAYLEALARQEDAFVYGALAALYQRQGKLNLAAQAYEKAVALGPDNADYKASLALVYIAQDRLDAAAKLTEEALSQRPEYAFAYFLLGLIAEKRHEPKRAALAYEAAIRYSGTDENLRQSAEAQLRLLLKRP